jgi:hypothetical protein
MQSCVTTGFLKAIAKNSANSRLLKSVRQEITVVYATIAAFD